MTLTAVGSIYLLGSFIFSFMSHYREVPNVTAAQRFDQYRCELEVVRAIARLVAEDNEQRACNRLAEHVRQQAEISANAEHAILLIEEATRRARSLMPNVKDERAGQVAQSVRKHDL